MRYSDNKVFHKYLLDVMEENLNYNEEISNMDVSDISKDFQVTDPQEGVSKPSTSNNLPPSCYNQERERRSSNPTLGMTSSHRYFPPRLDSVLYQAEVFDNFGTSMLKPKDDEDHFARVNWFKGSKHVSSDLPDVQNAIREFLKITRNLFEPVCLTGEDRWRDLDGSPIFDIPLESDERAIAYLADFDYDVQRACFSLYASLGSGKDWVQSNSYHSIIDRVSNGLAFIEYKDKINKSAKPLLGAFHSHTSADDVNGAIVNAKRPHVYCMQSFPRSVESDVSQSESLAVNVLSQSESNSSLVYSITGRGIRTGDKDKQETKKRWLNLYDRGLTFRRYPLFNLSQAQEILDEAMSLPPYVSMAGDDGLGDKIKVFLGELVKDVTNSRTWIADMRDKLFKGKSLHDFKKHLSLSRHLRIPPDEVNQLQSLIEESEKLTAEGQLYLKQSNKSRGKLEDVSELLKKISKNAIPIPERTELEKLYDQGTALMDRVKATIILHEVTASIKPSSNAKAKDYLCNMRKISIQESIELLNTCRSFAFEIPRVNELSAIIDSGIQWRQEVNTLTDGNKAVSMRRVDHLLYVADTLPFYFPIEIEKLKDKKNHAKQWLEKMKKTFNAKFVSNESSSGRAIRKVAGDTVNDADQSNDDRRLGLSDMKLMVKEGQLLLESDDPANGDSNTSKSHNRELLKAQSIVEVADNWLERVRDMLRGELMFHSSGELVDEMSDSSREPTKETDMNQMISHLREMLKEADQMPVVMDEMILLRCQIMLYDWTLKARQILNPTGPSNTAQPLSTMKLGDLQKLYREVSKIRDSIPESLLDEYPNMKRLLPEENKCRDIIQTAESWMENLKRLTQNNAVKRGTSLDKVLSIYQQSLSIGLDIDSEIKPMKSALTSAMNWVTKHLSILQQLNIIKTTDATSDMSPQQSDKESNNSVYHCIISDEAMWHRLKSSSHSSDNLSSVSNTKLNQTQSSETLVDCSIASNDVNSVNDGSENNQSMVENIEKSLQENNVDSCTHSPQHLSKSQNFVSYGTLHQLVTAGGNLMIDFDEIRVAREMLAKVELWQTRVQEALSNSLLSSILSSRSSRSKPSTSITTSKGGRRTTGVPLSMSNDPIFMNCTNRSELLEILLAQADELGIHVESERNKISSVLAMSRNWDKLALSKLDELNDKESIELMMKALTTVFVCEVQLENKMNEASSEQTLADTERMEVSANISGRNTVLRYLLHELYPLYLCIATDIFDVSKFKMPEVSAIYSFLRGVDQSIQISQLNSNLDEVEIIVAQSVTVFTSLIPQVKKGTSATHVNASSTTSTIPKVEELEEYVEDMAIIADELSNLLEDADSKGVVGSTMKLMIRSCVSSIHWALSIRDILHHQGLDQDLSHRSSLGLLSSSMLSMKKYVHWGDVDISYLDELIKMMENMLSLCSYEPLPIELQKSFSYMKTASSEVIDLMNNLHQWTVQGQTKDSSKMDDSMSAANDDFMDGGEISATATGVVRTSKRSSRGTNRTEEPQPLPASTAVTSQIKKGKSKNPPKTKENENVSTTLQDERRLSEAPLGDAGDDDDQIANGFSKTTLNLIKSFNAVVVQMKESATGKDSKNEFVIPKLVSLFVLTFKELVSVFRLRHMETQIWLSKVKDSLNIPNVGNFQPRPALSVITGHCTNEMVILNLLQIATIRRLDSEEVIQLQQYLTVFIQWRKTAQGILSKDKNTPLLTIDDLRKFIRDGEQLIFDCIEINQLKNELRRAKQLKTRIDRLGEKLLQIQDSEMNELISEAASISVDLSEPLQALTEAKLKYCLCRQEYHSEMVGCDTCKEWYHCACVGLSKASADKLDCYICIRCALVSSFEACATNAAHIVNRWMIPENVARWRDHTVAKIQKRVLKESKEVNRLENQLYEVLKPSTSSTIRHVPVPTTVVNEYSSSESLAMSQLSESSSATMNPGSVNTQSREAAEAVRAIRNELDEARKRLTRTRQEEAEANKRRLLEDNVTEDCQDWMVVLQRILWPNTKEENSAGQPLNLSSFTPHSNPSILFYPRKSDETLLKTMVPDAIRRAAEAAVALNIDKVDDVIEMVESFRWMSWCNITLHAIRTPLTTVGLHKLVEVGKTMRFSDEKIMKLFQHIAGKAANWKLRAKKAVTSRSLDLNKLTELVLEGNTIPINSRMKVALKEQLKRYQQDNRRQSSDTSNEMSDGVLTTRRSAAVNNRAISYTGFISFPTTIPDSSDDEEGSSGSTVADAEPSGETLSNPTSYLYEDFPLSSYAAIPKDLWPVKLGVGAISRVSNRNPSSSQSSSQYGPRPAQISNTAGFGQKTGISSQVKVASNIGSSYPNSKGSTSSLGAVRPPGSNYSSSVLGSSSTTAIGLNRLPLKRPVSSTTSVPPVIDRNFNALTVKAVAGAIETTSSTHDADGNPSKKLKTDEVIAVASQSSSATSNVITAPSSGVVHSVPAAVATEKSEEKSSSDKMSE